ncbi:MAG TPA: PTS system mannose/fructose/sorbose family transporter subunit IID [Ktedonobacteraceae bacterium]|nr:PTS system mannose/fructose/sorbose family transporter subunit IID [Ktedonobacteraceae bacterium]
MSDQLEHTSTSSDGEVTEVTNDAPVATVDGGEVAGNGDNGGPGGVTELSRSVLNRAMWRHLITLQWSWNYERMQGLGYLYSMMPVINAVYPNREERIAAMKRHLVFYNTNNYIGSPEIFGATVALEAQKEGGVVDSLKVGLMGPLAGIGDTFIGVLLRPIVAVIAASLAMAGNYGGPFLMLATSIFLVGIMVPQYWFGYRQGINVAKEVSGTGRITQITEMVTMMGLIVIGGFIPSILSSVTTPLKYQQTVTAVINGVKQTKTQVVSVQTGVLDKILPFAIPVLLVALAYWLLRGLKLSPVWVLLILAVVAFILSVTGVLGIAA